MRYLLLILCLTGCVKVSFEREKEPNREVHGITKIFHHDGRSFSAMVKQKDGSEAIRWFGVCGEISGQVRFVRDVPADQDSWVVLLDHGICTSGPNELVFHIHKAEDIQGGSYHQGKSTVKVNVVE